MRKLTPLLALALASLTVAACGGDADKPTSPAKAADPTAETETAAAAAGAPLTQAQVSAIPLGARRTSVLGGLGTPLKGADYALTADERRSCAFYANAGASGTVSYDNVWRFCFEHDKLISVGTAPLRKNAGPDAGKVSKHPGKALVQPKA